jgi:hypothetical protein
MISYKHFPPEQILEAKNYYFDEAQRHISRDHKQQAIDFVKYFDLYRDTIADPPKRRKIQSDESWVRHNLNRVEAMIERYFILKEKKRL